MAHKSTCKNILKKYIFVNRINGTLAECSGNMYFLVRNTNKGGKFEKNVNIDENNRIFVSFFDDYQSTKTRLSSYLLNFFQIFSFDSFFSPEATHFLKIWHDPVYS